MRKESGLCDLIQRQKAAAYNDADWLLYLNINHIETCDSNLSSSKAKSRNCSLVYWGKDVVLFLRISGCVKKDQT